MSEPCSFLLYVDVHLTFISLKFGGRDAGFAPLKGTKLCRGAEQVVTGLEGEEEDGR